MLVSRDNIAIILLLRSILATCTYQAGRQFYTGDLKLFGVSVPLSCKLSSIHDRSTRLSRKLAFLRELPHGAALTRRIDDAI